MSAWLFGYQFPCIVYVRRYSALLAIGTDTVIHYKRPPFVAAEYNQ
jgi:hypothetical protein